MIFIYLEKAYDKIPENVMWWTLEKKKVSTKYIALIKDIYINIVISIRTCVDKSNVFSIKIGLHQRSALNQYMFTLVMNEVTKDIQGDIFCGMFFANDVVLTDNSRIRVD
jgi:hypothetical protein